MPLPSWAADLGDGGALLVPASAVGDGPGEGWQRTDWLGAAEWYLSGTAERAFEERHGPIHSYSFRLGGWDARLWRRAWVNRIALFLRRWAASIRGGDERDLFGPVPRAEIVMTHDVDAVRNSLSLRLKQSAFHAFNAVRNAGAGRLKRAARKSADSARFFFGSSKLWFFDEITSKEADLGIRSHFNFYARTGRKSLAAAIIDPRYEVSEPKLRAELQRLARGGWRIGLHQSFDSWADPDRMRREKQMVETAAGVPVTSCRQHWLRFSWTRTWSAQREAGFELDTTLGFNDRPGFRTAAALRFQPIGGSTFEVMPSILMDSHLYDYSEMTDQQRLDEMAHWIGEVKTVGGAAAVLWHQQVVGPQYGWGAGFDELLRLITR